MLFILPEDEYTAWFQNFYLEDVCQKIDCIQSNIIKMYKRSLHLIVAQISKKLFVHS
jgi:hypothetical protein